MKAVMVIKGRERAEQDISRVKSFPAVAARADRARHSGDAHNTTGTSRRRVDVSLLAAVH